MTKQEIGDYLLSFADAWLDFSFSEKLSAYKVGYKDKNEGKIFALIDENSNLLRISLKCDPLLAENLREQYETVLPAKDLNKKYWNTIICTGQVSDEDLKSLILLSYNLVSKDFQEAANN